MDPKEARVAVVDDDPFVLGIAASASIRGLRRGHLRIGSRVSESRAGGEPDCVVLDLHMPETSGFDVQNRLAERGAGTPVIVITGDDTPEARSRALGLGAKAYFGKPVDEATLLAAINSAICGSASHS